YVAALFESLNHVPVFARPHVRLSEAVVSEVEQWVEIYRRPELLGCSVPRLVLEELLAHTQVPLRQLFFRRLVDESRGNDEQGSEHDHPPSVRRYSRTGGCFGSSSSERRRSCRAAARSPAHNRASPSDANAFASFGVRRVT